MMIHVICGGGTGASLMKLLLEQGYSVSTGVLNTLDTDYDAALTLGIPVVSGAPFSPITDEAYMVNLDVINDARAVVVSDVPFGHSNLKNLEAAKLAQEKGKEIVLVEETPIQKRDFTNGKAQLLFEELRSKGATVVDDFRKVFAILKTLEKI